MIWPKMTVECLEHQPVMVWPGRLVGALAEAVEQIVVGDGEIGFLGAMD